MADPVRRDRLVCEMLLRLTRHLTMLMRWSTRIFLVLTAFHVIQRACVGYSDRMRGYRVHSQRSRTFERI